MKRKNKKKIAEKRIDILFEEAKKAALRNEINKSDKYVKLARKLGMRHNISLDSKYRRRFCNKCYAYLFPNKTCKVRIERRTLITHCFKCGTINRFKIEKNK